MRFCDLSDDWTRDEPYLRCVDHNLPAKHVGTDGDSPVCEEFVKVEGCNCCPENFDKKYHRQRMCASMSQVQDDKTLDRVRTVLKNNRIKDNTAEELIEDLFSSGVIFLSLSKETHG